MKPSQQTKRGDSSRSGATLSALRNSPGRFTFAALLAGLLLLLFSAPSARAQGIPPGCSGSAIGISLFTSAPDVHIGDTLFYSVSVFNGLPVQPKACDASNIVASITTPDGVIHPIVLRRTYLFWTHSDYYANVVSYVTRAIDVRPDGSLRAVAQVTAVIYQNATPSTGGANQGVNTEVSVPCIALTVQCAGGVGENGAITFTGTVTNCGNNTLVGVTVTNFVNGGQFHVTFITNLLRGQIASFSGSWVPLNPCSPSTAPFVAQGTDQFTTIPMTVMNQTTVSCFCLDPTKLDTDGDGLSDHDELFVYGTNPLKADTDGDGIPDKWEVDHGLNPLVNDAARIGPAGVSNLQIYQYDIAHTNQVDQLDPHNPFFAPGTSIYEVLNNGQHTNRFYYDRDDRLVGAEYSRGISIAYQYDGNGNLTRQKVLSRANETNGLPVLWQFLNGLTNGTAADGPYGDADGDGWSNYQEWLAGTSPVDTNSVPGTNAVQTAPLAVVLPATNSLGNFALLSIRLWDAEGNASTPYLQYQLSSSTNWQDATLAYLDGALYTTNTRVTATPAGTNHALVWNALTNLGAVVNTNILLRARARDITLLGAWSAGTPFTVQTTANPDTDNDGLPDWWEIQYFGSTAANPDGDPDGDGFKNWQEYVADTNPTNTASHLTFSVSLLSGSVKLDWLAGSNSWKYLQRAISLSETNAAWLNIWTSPPPPSPDSGSFTDSFGTNAMQFYRIKATRP